MSSVSSLFCISCNHLSRANSQRLSTASQTPLLPAFPTSSAAAWLGIWSQTPSEAMMIKWFSLGPSMSLSALGPKRCMLGLWETPMLCSSVSPTALETASPTLFSSNPATLLFSMSTELTDFLDLFLPTGSALLVTRKVPCESRTTSPPNCMMRSRSSACCGLWSAVQYAIDSPLQTRHRESPTQARTNLCASHSHIPRVSVDPD
mmetsp:Transcript_6764/g.14707  ORF Transcript_6764/g.14707 Transcript_6764/m.14707 type:complete len:205 (+) Transcript_6764:55-669(+)